jgi:hypothetical protein
MQIINKLVLTRFYATEKTVAPRRKSGQFVNEFKVPHFAAFQNTSEMFVSWVEFPADTNLYSKRE